LQSQEAQKKSKKKKKKKGKEVESDPEELTHEVEASLAELHLEPPAKEPGPAPDTSGSFLHRDFTALNAHVAVRTDWNPFPDAWRREIGPLDTRMLTCVSFSRWAN